MANTGFLNPVSAFTVSAGAGGNRAWTSAGSTGTLFSAARESDNVRVLVNDLSGSVVPFPFFARFSPGLPASAEVQGFTVRYERRGNSTAVSANETWLRLVSGAGAGVQLLGTTANSNVANLSATDTYFSAGGSGSMFGLTTADASAGRVNSLGFAVNIRYGTGTTLTSAIAQIDHMQLQVHYTVPSTNAEPFSAEIALEVEDTGLVSNILGQSSEWGSEAEGSWLTGNMVVTGYEAGSEAQSVSIANPPIPVNGVECEYEATLVGLSLNTSVESAEFDRGQTSVEVSRNVAVLSVEIEQETANAALQNNAIVQSFERDDELTSVGFGAPELIVLSGEFANESGNVGLILDVAAQSAEVDLEATGVGLNRNVVAQSIEMDRDYESAGVESLSTVLVGEAEFGGEYRSVGVMTTAVYWLEVKNFEFGGAYTPLSPSVPAGKFSKLRPNTLLNKRRLRARHLWG